MDSRNELLWKNVQFSQGKDPVRGDALKLYCD